MTQEEARVARTCGVKREDFEAERKRELEETAALARTGQDGGTLSAEDANCIRKFGLNRESFVETRRVYGTT